MLDWNSWTSWVSWKPALKSRGRKMPCPVVYIGKSGLMYIPADVVEGSGIRQKEYTSRKTGLAVNLKTRVSTNPPAVMMCAVGKSAINTSIHALRRDGEAGYTASVKALMAEMFPDGNFHGYFKVELEPQHTRFIIRLDSPILVGEWYDRM